MTKTPAKLDWHNIAGVAHTRYPLSIHFNTLKITKFKMQKKKSAKINLRITSNPHAHLQTMKNTPVKFQTNWHNTVGGVAHTRYPIHIHFDRIRASKMIMFKMRKKSQKLI